MFKGSTETVLKGGKGKKSYTRTKEDESKVIKVGKKRKKRLLHPALTMLLVHVRIINATSPRLLLAIKAMGGKIRVETALT